MTTPDIVTYPKFYDSAQWHAIPLASDAALYYDGLFAAPPVAPSLLRLTGVRWITIKGDYQHASIIDYENLEPDFNPVSLRSFVRGRRAANQHAIVYCNLSTAAETVSALLGNGAVEPELLDYDKLLWWIATLDDVTFTPDQLASLLANMYNAPEITAGRIWANQAGQIENGTVDSSNLFMPFRP